MVSSLATKGAAPLGSDLSQPCSAERWRGDIIASSLVIAVAGYDQSVQPVLQPRVTKLLT